MQKQIINCLPNEHFSLTEKDIRTFTFTGNILDNGHLVCNMYIDGKFACTTNTPNPSQMVFIQDSLPSDELFSEVIGVDVSYMGTRNYNKSKYFRFRNNESTKRNGYGNEIEINSYELANLCKQFAITYTIPLVSSTFFSIEDMEEGFNVGEVGSYCILDDGNMNTCDEQMFYAKTEYEAIFKACIWIFENKGNKNDK